MSRDSQTWSYLIQNAREREDEAKVHIKNVSNNIGVFKNNKPDRRAKFF